jgi:hypothetical protein
MKKKPFSLGGWDGSVSQQDWETAKKLFSLGGWDGSVSQQDWETG